ncbi:putative mini-chromosome maintenance complex-binding protein [Helianthus annuus]|uniref:Mini-chromosome maintenance complex-binding protein n=1 Tax=Helianthus annuus TaxID=4232 RepID=A0A9K3IXF0_HELAN|nr:putative mini-chromosome maintenance complex-binding protein [Helianthus annuus]KAJ0569327.1 putative mini-chromosome maintenance complex-binding protein [Helianthus annuus]KAJ0583638.1 putative mini-chromosome maintenance complex-binding protein [Helianthus annuus]KAJ0746362.1 putative mini-chromosome maintenance complex-binding protein [Helianthus annuus]
MRCCWVRETLDWALVKVVEAGDRVIAVNVVENDMVVVRQADRDLGTQDFSRWLAIERLMVPSFGETCLLHEHWEMVKEMELLRKDRPNKCINS